MCTTYTGSDRCVYCICKICIHAESHTHIYIFICIHSHTKTHTPTRAHPPTHPPRPRTPTLLPLQGLPSFGSASSLCFCVFSLSLSVTLSPFKRLHEILEASIRSLSFISFPRSTLEAAGRIRLKVSSLCKDPCKGSPQFRRCSKLVLPSSSKVADSL